MNVRLPFGIGAVLLLAGASSRAQIPPYATLLNPGTPVTDFELGQYRDVVIAFDSGSHTRSTDGGRTWQPLQTAPLYLERLATSPGLLVFAGIGGGSVSILRSIDDGGTWSAPIPVHALTVQDAWTGIPWWQGNRRSAVQIDGSNVVVVWSDLTGNGSMWAKRSTDGGLTWPTPPVRLDVGLNSSLIEAYTPQLLAQGPLLQAFWAQTYFNNALAIAQQVSTDGGVTWLPAARLAVAPSQPGIAGVAWNGNDLLLARQTQPPLRSTDGGLTWSSVTVTMMATILHIASSGPVVVAAGTLSPVSGAAPTYVVNVSLDGGLTWQPNPWLAASFSGFMPKAYIVGADLYVHFFNPNAPAATSLVIHSADSGQTWRALQQGVTAFSPGERRNVHVTRTGTSAAPSQHYAFVGTGYSVLGTGTPGTGGLVPSLHLDGLPLLGATTQLTVDQVPTNTLGTMNLSFAPPVAFPFVGGTVYLQGPLATVVFASGAAGVGQVAVPIPNNPSLAGLSLPAQALAIDVAANSGFSLSNAIEIWVR